MAETPQDPASTPPRQENLSIPAVITVTPENRGELLAARGRYADRIRERKRLLSSRLRYSLTQTLLEEGSLSIAEVQGVVESTLRTLAAYAQGRLDLVTPAQHTETSKGENPPPPAGLDQLMEGS